VFYIQYISVYGPVVYVRRELAIITLRAKLSGTVYCNWSCLFVCVFISLWDCYHNNSKLRASIFTKLGL